jgi:hypothetical protein
MRQAAWPRWMLTALVGAGGGSVAYGLDGKKKQVLKW